MPGSAEAYKHNEALLGPRAEQSLTRTRCVPLCCLLQLEDEGLQVEAQDAGDLPAAYEIDTLADDEARLGLPGDFLLLRLNAWLTAEV